MLNFNSCVAQAPAMPVRLVNRFIPPPECEYCGGRQCVRACVLCGESVRVCCGGSLLLSVRVCVACYTRLPTAPNRAVHVWGPSGRASWKRRNAEWLQWLDNTVEAVEGAAVTLGALEVAWAKVPKPRPR